MKTKAKTILFVEDNPLVVQIYRTWLQREGYEVALAEDGEVALTKLPLLKPALVILDMMLPKRNGSEVLHFIRGQAGLKATPVLILSNAYLDDHATRAMTVSADKRLLKTHCTPSVLIQAVRELIGAATASSSAPAGAPSANGANGAAGRELRHSLLRDAPAEIAKIREYWLEIVKTAGPGFRTGRMNEMFQRVRLLCARSGLEECTKVAHVASALEAMLFEIIFKESAPSPSAFPTITQAVDCLDRLLRSDDLYSAEVALTAKVLVVDDDPVCNYVTVTAMKRAKLEAVSAQDPQAALELAKKEHYDIVLLDISMPKLNGFDVCKGLRRLAGYERTPVIFVTACNDFENRAQAVLSGGNDIIAKPISPLELVLKTLMHLVEGPEPAGAARPKPETPAPSAGAPAAASVLEPVESPAGSLFAQNGSNGAGEGHKPAEHVPPILQPAPPGAANPAVAREEGKTNHRPPPSRETAPRFAIPAPQLPRISQPSVRRNHETPMKNQTENLSPVEELSRVLARIMFGDDQASEMQQRLTRIALEHYKVPEILCPGPAANGDAGDPLEGVVRGVTRVFFGDDGLSEMHLRLTRIALDRYDVPSLIVRQPEANGLDDLRMCDKSERLMV